MSNVSEKYITYASLARDIGLTAAKLLSGQTVLGITGTGATTHSGTYTFAANDTGGTKDLGEKHTYRYVNATNVYNKGKTDGSATITRLSNLSVTTNQNKVIKSSSSLAAYKYCVIVASVAAKGTWTASNCTIVDQVAVWGVSSNGQLAEPCGLNMIVIGSITGAITLTLTSSGTGAGVVYGWGIK